MDRDAAIKRLQQLEAARDSFSGWVSARHPDWEIPWFQARLIEVLDALEKGELTSTYTPYARKRDARFGDGDIVHNVMIGMPPRHAKSTYCTVEFSGYALVRDPARHIMNCTYNAELSTDFGRQIRAIMQEPLTRQINEDAELAKDSQAANVFRTAVGGAYYGVGLGGTTAGRPANILTIDDPIKAREQAESQTIRNKAWSYYTSALITRLQPDTHNRPPTQLLIGTRWHPDDPFGRIMQTDDWRAGRWCHIVFEGLARKATGDKVDVRQLPKGHPDREAAIKARQSSIEVTEEIPLWPARFDLETLKRRRTLNPREFEALYQQRPTIEGGNLFKTEWWQFYAVPDEHYATMIVSSDTALKAKESSDYSAALVLGLTQGGDIHLLDVVRGKWDFTQLRARMVTLNAAYRGKGLRALYIEDKGNGPAIAQSLRQESGLSVITHNVVSDKVQRAQLVLDLIRGGRVYLPQEAHWLDAFMTETQQFPSGKNDDQVDALTMGLDVLSRTGLASDGMYAAPDMTQSLNKQVRDPRVFSKNYGKALGGNFSWRGWGQ